MLLLKSKFHHGLNKHQVSFKFDLKKEKATHGQLVHIEGNNVTVVKYNAPWALLQSLKSQYSFTEQKKLFLKSLSWTNNT